MAERPALHLTNWASRAQHGPGRRLCVMAYPRTWELGDGTVLAAVPGGRQVRAFLAGELSVEAYRSHVEKYAASRMCGPGELMFAPRIGTHLGPATPVQGGDTLLCSCPRPDSPRRTHPCHLEWLAPYLVRAGWRVVLYGQEIAP